MQPVPPGVTTGATTRFSTMSIRGQSVAYGGGTGCAGVLRTIRGASDEWYRGSVTPDLPSATEAPGRYAGALLRPTFRQTIRARLSMPPGQEGGGWQINVHYTLFYLTNLLHRYYVHSTH